MKYNVYNLTSHEMTEEQVMGMIKLGECQYDLRPRGQPFGSHISMLNWVRDVEELVPQITNPGDGSHTYFIIGGNTAAFMMMIKSITDKLRSRGVDEKDVVTYMYSLCARRNDNVVPGSCNDTFKFSHSKWEYFN